MALEQETSAILRILAEKTIGDRPTCRLDTLLGADVPPGIKSFFRAEIRHKLEGDLQKSPWFSHVRQSDVGSARMAQALLASVTDAYQYSRREFLDTLDLAVHFLANYLCRPRWTLENFLFDRTQRISFASLSEGFSHVADYRYLGVLMMQALQRRGQTEVGREEFRSLIGRIDDEVVRQHNGRELASLTRPLFSFFHIPAMQADGAIPVEALLVFFDDKGMRVLKEYVRGICHLRTRTHVTFEELAQLIEDLSSNRSSESLEAAPETELPPVEAPPETPPTVAPPAAPPAPEPAPPRTNVALSLTFAGLRGNVEPRPSLPEISTLIPQDQKDRFVTHVFKGDAAHYAGALAMLNSCKTWGDAEAYLSELFHMNGLDPHSDDAADFSGIIRRRYTSTERLP